MSCSIKQHFKDGWPRRALTGSTNAMKVCFPKLGKVEVDHNIHSLNVNTSCEEVYEKKEKTARAKVTEAGFIFYSYRLWHTE